MTSNAAASLPARLFGAWKSDERLRLVVYAAVLVVALQPINLLMQFVFSVSSLKPLHLWLLENNLVTDDSWRPMQAAWDWLREGGQDGSLYREIFFEQKYKFQYAPTSLLIYAGLDGIGITPDALTLNRISRVLLLATSAALGALAWILLKRARPDAGPAAPAAFAALAAGTSFLFFPLTYGYLLGQLQVWSNAFFAFACLALILDRRALAGVLLGLVCLLKPQLGVFAIWGLVQRDWRFLGALVATGAVGLLLSVMLFGVHNHIAYLETLSFMSRHGEAHLSNHSFNGLLHRVTGNDDGLTWSNEMFPPFSAWVYGGTLATSLALIGFGLWPLAGAKRGRVELTPFLFTAIAFTIASPMAWEPHFGVLAPALVMLFALALGAPKGPARRKWLLVVTLCFALSAPYLPFVQAFAHTPLLVLQSYLLFAALALMFMLRRRALALANGAITPDPTLPSDRE